MPTLIITVDLQCCRCSTKIQKLLCCIQEGCEFEIEKIVYEKDTVVVSGPFDAEKLSCVLWCKAGKIIKCIKIKPPEKEKEKEKPKPEPCKLIPLSYPYCPPPQRCPPTPSCPPCGCATPHCECHCKPAPPPPPPPPPAEPPKPACGCPANWSPSCHSCSRCYPAPPYPPPAMAYPPVLLCDESPQYGACAVM
ncbi:protein PYRICULARIA ORYZAE RESISTANCE 21-like [Oryza brachyantha]|uniref:protein PYRICULARIA ORYZAE RESISTANCE 21-like n=1 Tax=Oryza brachyantha TaxID=4533 RepID=UPI001ADAA189|nr:protein PYRICULARIA ORYZAE RESISTANCE 21-like [Oryza brachyantha]